MIVGQTKRLVSSWAAAASNVGERFVAKPTMRSKACRCVIDAIKAGMKVDKSKAFSFKLYVRTWILAEKVKGKVRAATECLHKGEAVDDTDALIPFVTYIDRKMFEAIEHMPPLRQQSLLNHLRRNGWDIVTEI